MKKQVTQGRGVLSDGADVEAVGARARIEAASKGVLDIEPVPALMKEIIDDMAEYRKIGEKKQKLLTELLDQADKVEAACVRALKELQSMQKTWKKDDHEKYDDAYDWLDRFLTFCKAAANKEYQRLAVAGNKWSVAASFIAYPGAGKR